MPHQQQTVEAIGNAMASHGLRAATFVGHSLGTVYLSWVAQLRPSLMASSVFIDPICFLLHQPKIASQFLYDAPKDTLSAVENYFIKSEHSIVSYFHRHFFWEDIVLWRDDLAHSPASVVLSSEDALVPVDKVVRYLRRRPGMRGRLDVTVLDGARHGGFLMQRDHRSDTLAIVRTSQRRGARHLRRRSQQQQQQRSEQQQRQQRPQPTGARAGHERSAATVGGHWTGAARALEAALWFPRLLWRSAKYYAACLSRRLLPQQSTTQRGSAPPPPADQPHQPAPRVAGRLAQRQAPPTQREPRWRGVV